MSSLGKISTQVTPMEWGSWPTSTAEIEQAVLTVLRSGRWAISGMSTGKEGEERRFAKIFAEYLGVEVAVPTSSGSSALATALQACGVGYGDEVLVPGLAWVACASAVARVGAIPVFVDVDPEVYAMDPQAAESLVGPRAAAILVTHLSSSIADVDAFAAIADKHNLMMIEDGSQAHGAIWRGQRVGSFGDAAAFSFQSSKLLTAGEGGAAVSRRGELATALEQIRADGRVWNGPAEPGFPDLQPGEGEQGHNHCMTEMQAAILSASLPLLDDQHDMRLRGVECLELHLSEMEGVKVLRRRGDQRVDRETFWHLPIQIDEEAFGGATAEVVRATLARSTGLYLEPVGAPMPVHPLYRPQFYRRFPEEHRRLSLIHI